MKALTINIDKYVELKQKLESDSKFNLNIYDLVEFANIPEFGLINQNWVKIKNKLGGICGSDFHFLTLDTSMCLSNFASFPAVPGHEIVGTVVEVGEQVQQISSGDRVVIDEILGCETRGLDPCYRCQEGEYNLCSNYDQGDLSPGLMHGFCKDTGGGWGEYVVAHKSQVFKIPDSVSDEEALLAEPLACAIHGILKHLPKDEENCVVVGGGTIGLVTLQALKALSNCKIYATAKYPFQLELGQKFGADEVIQVKKDLHIKKIARKLGCRIVTPLLEDAFPVGGGADVVIDTVGNASSLSNSLRLVKSKGTVILIGYPSYLTIDWTPVMAKEINIIPSNIFSNEIYKGEKKRTLEVALNMIESGKVDVKDFITHKFSIENYKKALEVAVNKNQFSTIKTAFIYD